MSPAEYETRNHGGDAKVAAEAWAAERDRQKTLAEAKDVRVETVEHPYPVLVLTCKTLKGIRAAVACHPHALIRLIRDAYGARGVRRMRAIKVRLLCSSFQSLPDELI
jgi:hypothetical protein